MRGVRGGALWAFRAVGGFPAITPPPFHPLTPHFSASHAACAPGCPHQPASYTGRCAEAGAVAPPVADADAAADAADVELEVDEPGEEAEDEALEARAAGRADSDAEGGSGAAEAPPAPYRVLMPSDVDAEVRGAAGPLPPAWTLR